MIRIVIGNIGSGKTASVVREMALNKSGRMTYSNIITEQIPNNITIERGMIIKGIDKDISLNIDFWKNQTKTNNALNVILDEAHTLLNPRRAMSKQNIIMSDFLALLRRVLGSADSGYGTLTLITQLERRLDPIAKEMSTNVRFCVCHYKKSCMKCGFTWRENNETAEPGFQCQKCGSKEIKKHSHTVEVWHFRSFEHFNAWKECGEKTYHKHYIINDIEKYFPLYNTMQWDNLISQY